MQVLIAKDEQSLQEFENKGTYAVQRQSYGTEMWDFKGF
jgi:hypothetical protein